MLRVFSLPFPLFISLLFPFLCCAIEPGDHRDIVDGLRYLGLALQPRQRECRLAVQFAQPICTNTGQLGRSRRRFPDIR